MMWAMFCLPRLPKALIVLDSLSGNCAKGKQQQQRELHVPNTGNYKAGRVSSETFFKKVYSA